MNENLSHDGVFERRRTRRFSFDVVMPAVLGRLDALLLDISTTGARLTHFAPQPLDAPVRLMLAYHDQRFFATGRVLASRVRGLGTGPSGATTYESRLRFVDCSFEAAQALDQIIAGIQSDRQEQRNAHSAGFYALQAAAGSDDLGYFIRCRLRGRRWVHSWSREGAQPSDGFTVPARLGEGEVELLCSAYERTDQAGRDLIRATAAGVTETSNRCAPDAAHARREKRRFDSGRSTPYARVAMRPAAAATIG